MDREKEKSREVLEAYCRDLKFHWGTYDKILPKKYRPMFCEPVLERTSELAIRRWHDIMSHSITEGKSLSSLWEKGGWLYEEINQPQIKEFHNGQPLFCNTVLHRVITKYKIPRSASGDEDEKGDIETKSELLSENTQAAKPSNIQKRKAESGNGQQGVSTSNKQPRLGQVADGEEPSFTEQKMQQSVATIWSQKRLHGVELKMAGHQHGIRLKLEYINGKQHEIYNRRDEIERLEEEIHQLQENLKEDEAKVVSCRAEAAKAEEECRLHTNILQAMRELAKFQEENTQAQT